MVRYRSFLLAEARVEGNFLTLDSRESHHLVRVLRAKVGDSIEVLDGRGLRYRGRIVDADAKAARVEFLETHRSAPRVPKLTLVQSIPKGKTMDLILRMATEIGATCVQPVFTDHGEVSIRGERLVSKVSKWRTTMIESCKQCGLGFLPELAEPLPLSAWLHDERADKSVLKIVASLEAGSRPLLEVIEASTDVSEIVVAVGPEGDFTTEEYAGLRGSGFLPVRLGANVLRAETAAAYILSVVDQAMVSGELEA